QEVARGGVRFTKQGRQDLALCFAIVEWLDQRLSERRRSVVSPRVTPCFQKVGCRDGPLAGERGFIPVEATVRALRNARDKACEVQGRWAAVRRVPTQNHQPLHRLRAD